MDFINLLGADDVKSAGYAMKDATEDMNRAASYIAESLDRQRLFLDDWLMRLENILKEKNNGLPA